MAKKKSDDVRKFSLDLPVKLTNEEHRQRGVELSEQMNELDKIDAKLDAAKEVAKGNRSPINDRIKELRKQLEDKAETRRVPCEERPDFKRRCAETTRLDTMEIIETKTRPLRPDEMQGNLALVPGQGRVGEVE